MKTLLLDEIITAIGINPKKFQEGVLISDVIHDISKVKNQTLLFHVRKKQILDGDKLTNYKHFYIVTDTPFTNMEKLEPEKIIFVDDVMSAFFKFTSFYRHMFTIPVVGITGTCGKTTTKEMLKHILQFDYNVQATIGNKNSSYFHLPYLVGMDEKTEVAVIEMGVSEPGDMKEVCNYFFPTVGIMTMIDIDHTDEFPSFKDYIAEKEKLINGLTNNGSLIINIDDPHISSMDFSEYKGNIVTYGKSDKASIQIRDIRFDQSGMAFNVEYEKKEYKGLIPGIGEHNVYNGVAAIAAAIELGVEITVAIKRLGLFKHVRSHFEIIHLQNQITIIDDTWKGNQTSLQNGLRLLDKISLPSQRKIAVLGRMAPLGQYSNEIYKTIGELLVEIRIDKLITKGFIGKDIAKAALLAGMSKRDVHHFTETHEIKDFLDKLLKPNDIVYFKVWANDESFYDLIQCLKREN